MVKQVGYELEFHDASLDLLAEKYQLQKYKKEVQVPYTNYFLKEEIPLTKHIYLGGESIGYGGEFISPILRDYEQCLKDLQFYLKILKDEGAAVQRNSWITPFHIHLDRTFLYSREKIEKLLKFLYAFQPEIYELAKGEFDKIRENIFVDFKPLCGEIIEQYLRTENEHFFHFKGSCILLDDQTLELRYFNASLQLHVLETYFQFAFHLRDYIINEQSDQELLEYFYQKALNNGDTLILSRKREKVMRQILQLEKKK